MLPGGGAALMDVQRRLASGPGPLTSGEAAGAAMVLDSLAGPLMQIAANAGHTDPAALADSIRSLKSGTGFDVITNSRTDMLAAGIVDSFSATSRAVTDAAHLTKRLLLANALQAGLRP
jgi:chaperonin GroEL (HSP60 family)